MVLVTVLTPDKASYLTIGLWVLVLTVAVPVLFLFSNNLAAWAAGSVQAVAAEAVCMPQPAERKPGKCKLAE